MHQIDITVGAPGKTFPILRAAFRAIHGQNPICEDMGPVCFILNFFLIRTRIQDICGSSVYY
jgi:hypothetical protein